MGGMETCDAAELLMKEKRRMAAKSKKKSRKEDDFDFELRRHRISGYSRNLMFAKEALGRLWKFDFAFPRFMVAIEIEGLDVRRVAIATLDEDTGRVIKIEYELIVRGRHASVEGFNEDCVKYANAAYLGWTVIRFTPKQIADGVAIEYTQRVLAAKGWKR